MNEQELLNALSVGEGTDWEFKSARGGLPGSMWETYSAMANTDGGIIGLGIDEKDGKFLVSGLAEPARIRKNFWDTINNRSKVSRSLLADADVQVLDVAGNPVMLVRVPRASRRERPVYVGQNPLDGTFRRNYEGDYRCRPEEVGRMLADQSDEPQDSLVLEHFGRDDLDQTSIDQFRNRFSARSATHPWLKLNESEFLEKLGAFRKERQSEAYGLTVAGLLMFGKDEAIRDPAGVPEFHLDYRERLSDDPAVRWTDRLYADGTWVCNIFQFYERVVPRLTADLKMPFQLKDLARKDDTIVHEAIREALVNSLIHADHRGQGGVVIERYRDRLEFSNPGTLLLEFDQILRGGVSECRNKTLQTMFSLLGYGEKAGSGFDKIRQGWASQHWRSPKIEETNRPDRVRVVLPMVSLLSEEAVERLRSRFGPNVDSLQPLEVQALVTAEAEGSVNNPRLREISEEHPADVSKMLQGLVSFGFLEQHGQRRWSYYRLATQAPHTRTGDSTHNGDETGGATGGTGGAVRGVDGSSSPHSDPSSSPNDPSSPPNDPSSADNDSSSANEAGMTDPVLGDAALLEIAEPARKKGRMTPAETEEIILRLCSGRYLSYRQIGQLLLRNARNTRKRFLSKLVQEGRLQVSYPNNPTHPNQAYTTTEDAS